MFQTSPLQHWHNDEINHDDVTPEVVELLLERSKFAVLKMHISEQLSKQSAKFTTHDQALKTSISTLAAQNQALRASLKQPLLPLK